MPSPTVSVVVPVYNTEKWLAEALGSIEGQPGRDLVEVIVVDDGSTDGSAEIAQRYATQATAVRYVRQDNAGLGAARNHGVRLATGRYLAFLDSDDIYPDGALSHLTGLADHHEAAIAVGDMQGLPPRPNPAWRRELLIGERVVEHIAHAPDLVGNPSACNKIFRRDLVDAVGVTFTEGTAFEDVLFTIPLLARSPRTILTPRLSYLYRQRGDNSSLMDSRSQPARIMQHLTIIERLADEVRDLRPDDREAVYRWIAYMQLHYAWRAAAGCDDDQLAEFTARIHSLFKDIPIDVASEFVGNAGAGLRAVAIYEQDAATVRRPRSSRPLRVHAGQPYLGHPDFDTYRDLLRVREMTVSVKALRGSRPVTGPAAAGPTVAVEGTVRCAGIDGEPGQVRSDLLLEVGDGLLRQPVTVESREGNDLRWSCRLAAGELAPGRYPVRLVVRDSGREYAVPPGPERGGRGTLGTGPTRVGARVLWLTPDAAGPTLVVTDGTAGTLARSPQWLSEMGARQSRNLLRRAWRTARSGRRRLTSRRTDS
ncbi:glycosyltransferase family 2 protein [Solwaraspora sp. WMMA2080]|uniref:glycosyltransferase family 2 protein n=1 Tax=unclassified Solwaraspora TaxID=2627926 RepID=UPI00248B9F7C|nr:MULTISPECIES: glycosyltransferase family 2 protein [unclassified Solwaraspora]WBB96475.1 glycosyltransferase family 2 protein [Solwaraspora sp. WMMA2059]WBC19619.1 glycosyltransferase family 2 protein [Solwaraspora sp. WMMA2080]